MHAPDPFAPGRVFCVGAAGAGVRAMAELLHGFGWEVSGTDRAKPAALERMRAKGLAVTHDPAGRSWDERPDLLLHSPAVPATDPARVRAEAERVPQVTQIDLLADLTRRRETIAVAGTHGKSGTAAILVHLLRGAGRRVAGFVGAEPVDPAYSFADPNPDLLVVEACEWNRHFLRLSPTHAVITGVEFDHPDSYRDAGELLAAFAQFRAGLPTDGTLFEGGQPSAFARVITIEAGGWRYGTPSASARRFRTDDDELTLRSRDWEVRAMLPFSAAAENVAFAAAAAVEFGAAPDAVAAAVPSAPALRRRFEPLGEWKDRTLIDDYAHHPAGLWWAAQRARAVSRSGGTVVVFQPHQSLRTRKLFLGFKAALREFDAAAVLPVFPARETASAKKCTKLSRDLAREARGRRSPSSPTLTPCRAGRTIRPPRATPSCSPGPAISTAPAPCSSPAPDTPRRPHDPPGRARPRRSARAAAGGRRRRSVRRGGPRRGRGADGRTARP